MNDKNLRIDLCLCTLGARVLMACRNLEKAEEAARDIKQQAERVRHVGSLVIKELDLSSLDSVRKCANEILKTEPAIHLLVNNAGKFILTQIRLRSK